MCAKIGHFFVAIIIFSIAVSNNASDWDPKAWREGMKSAESVEVDEQYTATNDVVLNSTSTYSNEVLSGELVSRGKSEENDNEFKQPHAEHQEEESPDTVEIDLRNTRDNPETVEINIKDMANNDDSTDDIGKWWSWW